MGEGCFVTLYWNKADTPTVLEVFGASKSEPDDNEPGEEQTGSGIEEFFYEANCGYETQLKALAAAGVPFHGHHSAGGCYGAGVFCSFGGEYIEVSSLEGFPAVAVNATNAPNSKPLPYPALWLSRYGVSVSAPTALPVNA